MFLFFSSRRRHTRCGRDWSSDVCSSDLNETVTGRKLIEAVERRKGTGDLQVTVIAPVSQPQRGYVVYEDTRRAAAGRRLDRTLSLLREEAISAHGLVVESDSVPAVRD